jgi:hypothetical protein
LDVFIFILLATPIYSQGGKKLIEYQRRAINI